MCYNVHRDRYVRMSLKKSSIQSIWGGKTLLRTLMHEALGAYTISGTVVDIGGGRNPEYFKYFKSSNTTAVIPVDLRPSQVGVVLNLETDRLPFQDDSVDGVLAFNILEHT